MSGTMTDKKHNLLMICADLIVILLILFIPTLLHG